jgi:hypothetical protein
MVRVVIVRAGLRTGRSGCWAALLCACALDPAQQHNSAPAQLNESGHILVAGRSDPLPHSPSAGQLVSRACPPRVQELLNRRGCLIPQTYEAHHPGERVHASLERAGSSDWAVLCSAEGTVSLLVFFSAPQPARGAGLRAETQRLQTHDPSGVLGFNWGIDPASPAAGSRGPDRHGARPLRVDHDALADSVVEHRTVYHFYGKSAWKSAAGSCWKGMPQYRG